MWVPPDIKNRFLDGAQRFGLIAGADDGLPIGLAISGGPDSLALLLLMHECFADRIYAATVDHRLRHEAAAEAQYVAHICAQRNIPHTTLTPTEPIAGNIQSAARHVRYALLENWADKNQCVYIATAHHADDQLETVLMRLSRGSGVDGLSGIRAVNGRIIRPLLAFTKDELSEICNNAGIIPVQDPSNRDLDFDRVRMRKWLASSPGPLNPLASVRSAAALADASAALDWITHKLAAERIERLSDSIILNPADLPHELLRRLLVHILAVIEPGNNVRGQSIEHSLSGLSSGQTITLGNVLCKGGGLWRFTLAPIRSSAKKTTI